MTITIIAAIGPSLELGAGGDLAYHISADLRRFKSLTMGGTIIMGRKTFESFPNGALPGRHNIVITRNPDYSAPGIETASGLEEALALAEGNEAFIIGGGEIYRQALPIASAMELTLVEQAPAAKADTWFPEFASEWNETTSGERITDERTGLTYRFARFEPLRDKKIPLEIR